MTYRDLSIEFLALKLLRRYVPGDCYVPDDAGHCGWAAKGMEKRSRISVRILLNIYKA